MKTNNISENGLRFEDQKKGHRAVFSHFHQIFSEEEEKLLWGIRLSIFPLV